jgi:predicted  nucleic acid-binding Zn-ribbon protein
MSDEGMNLVCKGCGQVFSAFLQQMADKNARVVCPKCGGCQEYTPSDIVSPSTSQRTAGGKGEP